MIVYAVKTCVRRNQTLFGGGRKGLSGMEFFQRVSAICWCLIVICESGMDCNFPIEVSLVLQPPCPDGGVFLAVYAAKWNLIARVVTYKNFRENNRFRENHHMDSSALIFNR